MTRPEDAAARAELERQLGPELWHNDDCTQVDLPPGDLTINLAALVDAVLAAQKPPRPRVIVSIELDDGAVLTSQEIELAPGEIHSLAPTITYGEHCVTITKVMLAPVARHVKEDPPSTA